MQDQESKKFFPVEIVRRILSHLPWSVLNAMAGNNSDANHYLSKEIMENLFSNYFPDIYKDIKVKGLRIEDWRALFLEHIGRAYRGCPAFQVDLFIAVGDRDAERFKMLLAGLNNSEALYRPHQLGLTVLECAALNNFDEGCSAAWQYIRNNPNYPLLQLKYAVMFGRPIQDIEEIVQLMIQQGTPRSDLMYRVLEESCLYGHSVGAQYALQDAELKNSLSTQLFSHLVIRACNYGHLPVVNVLLENNPAKTWINSPHLTEALWVACSMGRTAIAECLLDADPEALNRPNEHNVSLLGFVCNQAPHPHVAKYLLEKGADVTVLMNKHVINLIKMFRVDTKTPMVYYLEKCVESYLKHADLNENQLAGANSLLRALRNPSRENIDKLDTEEFQPAFADRKLNWMVLLFKATLKQQAHLVAGFVSKK